MAPQQRLPENQPLPKRWKWQHGALYYRVPVRDKHLWDGKSWFRLGESLAQAHTTFAERLQKESSTSVHTMQDLLDKFEFEHLPTLKPGGRKYYIYALPMVRKVFTTHPVPVKLVEPHHAYQMTEYLVKTESTKKAKQAAECLSSALSFAVRHGIIPRNPLIGQFKKPSTDASDREITDEELIAFAETLPRKWQLYISLKLQTHGRRKAEMFNIQRKDILDTGLLFVNNKRITDRFIVKWTPVLGDIVTEILELHPSWYPELDPAKDTTPLFYTRQKKAYIDKNGETSGFNSIWYRRMKSATKAGLCEWFTEHDIRAKAVEDETEDVASRLLRHTSKQVTRKHYRRKAEQL